MSKPTPRTLRREARDLARLADDYRSYAAQLTNPDAANALLDAAQWLVSAARELRRAARTIADADPIDAAAIVADYHAGAPIREIADRYAITPATVYAHLRRENVTLNRPAGRPRKVTV